MADLVTVANSDSVNDGGAGTILYPPQVSNATDDAILIKLTQSLNDSGQVANISLTTPTGYTALTNLTDNEIKSFVYYKRSTGNESIPSVTSNTSSKWTCSTAIVKDVDWTNGGVNQHVQNTGNSDLKSPDLTTHSAGSASAVVCFYSIERREIVGFKYPDSRTTTIYSGQVNTGLAEGVDNASAVGYDYIKDRNTTWTGPTWDAAGPGDAIAINVEVVTQNNIIPLQVANYVSQTAGSLSKVTNMDFVRESVIARNKDFSGNTLVSHTFDAESGVSTENNTITISNHGIDESALLYLETNGNEAPGGLANDTFYYCFPQDANTIKLCSVVEAATVTNTYYNGTTQRPVVGITSAGDGTITLKEARVVNYTQNTLDMFRPNNGNTSNPGSAPGNYIGDCGYNQNFFTTASKFASPINCTNKTISFEMQQPNPGKLSKVLMTLVDTDGDFVSYALNINSIISSTRRIYSFQVDKASVQAVKHAEAGTFNPASVDYIIISVKGNNTTTNAYSPGGGSDQGIVNFSEPLKFINGKDATITELVNVARSFTTNITQPSDLQVVSNSSLSIGDGTGDVSFSDSEKSIGFPPLANGTTVFQNYLEAFTFDIKPIATSSIKLANTQIGASTPYNFTVDAANGATVDISGNSYVFATATLDADINYDRQIFVGGSGVTDNNAQLRSCTFITNSQLGADKGMINLISTTDIENSTFQLSSGTTTGHGIKISNAGNYTFNNLTFSDFGSNGSNTAAIYNNSGGVVNIVRTSGTVPTVRNSTGSTTNITIPPNNVSITGIVAGSRIQIFNTTTNAQVVNEVVSGTSYTATYQEGTGYSANNVIRVRIIKIDKNEFSFTAVASASGWSGLAAQTEDTVYTAIGVDGSSITNFTADYTNDEVDLTTGGNFTVGDLYAWWKYTLTSSQGIADFFGGITAIDEANFRINTTIVDMFLNNNISASYRQTDNRRIFRSTGDGYPVKSPTTSGYGLDVVWRDKILIADVSDIAAIKAKTDQLNFTGTDIKATLDGETVVTDTASRNASKADVSGLSTFDASSDTVTTDTASRNASKADVSNLDVAVSTRSVFNAGSDTVTTDTASRNASKADVSGLSTFNNATDTVTTDTASRNASKADVSGLSTFNASSDTVTTDTASRNASKADVSGLSTLTSSDVTTAATTALNSYDAPTKAEMDAFQTSVETKVTSNFTLGGTIYNLVNFTTNSLITTVSGKVDTVDAVVDSIETKVDTVDTVVDSIETKVDILDTVADATKLLLDQTFTRLVQFDNNISPKIDIIDTNVDDIETLSNTINTKIDIVDTNVDDIEAKVVELWKLQGLDSSNPMTVTPKSRTTDAINLVISGDGVKTTTVTRQ